MSQVNYDRQYQRLDAIGLTSGWQHGVISGGLSAPPRNDRRELSQPGHLAVLQ